jgi:hypothetical protein
MLRFLRRHRAGILAIALVGILLSYGGLSSCVSFRAKVSEYNYYLIKKGMTEAEAEAILGPGHKFGDRLKVWASEECFIWISFDENGRVDHADFQPSTPPKPHIPRL